jgi:hypothetical protein
MFTAPELKKRGWTDTAIKKFLSEPDATKPNPHYKTAAPMRLYKKSRVYGKERSRAFKAWREGVDKRKAAAQKAVETKERKLLDKIESFEVSVDKITNVVKEACAHYNARNGMKIIDYGYEPATENSDKSFLDRITVNYIRHELTDYDYELMDLVGKVGKQSAYEKLVEKVYKEIGRVYPEYEFEADYQFFKKMCEVR